MINKRQQDIKEHFRKIIREIIFEENYIDDEEKFFIVVDSVGEGILRDELFGKVGVDYIDTPGMYQDEKKDYGYDIYDFMISNMGRKNFDELKKFYNKNKNFAKAFVKKYGKNKKLYEMKFKKYWRKKKVNIYENKRQQDIIDMMFTIRSQIKDGIKDEKKLFIYGKGSNPDFPNSLLKSLINKILKESTRQIIRDMIVDILKNDNEKDNDIEEITTTDDVAGYNIPAAFTGKDGVTRKKKWIKKIAGITGYEVIEDDDLPDKLTEGRRGVYHNFRDDDSMTGRQKIGESLRMVKDYLGEIEKIIDLNLRLKEDAGINTQQYWKRTHKAINRISEKMLRIQNKMRKF